MDWKRHIFSKHFPDSVHCPEASCPWRASRKDEFKKHLEDNPSHGQPDAERRREQYETYDTGLVLDMLLGGTVSFEVVREYAVDFVRERAKELEKEILWEVA